MKLALFGRTRGRGASVEQWPTYSSSLPQAPRPCRRSRSQIQAARCHQVSRNHAERNLLMAYETIACLQDTASKLSSTLNTAWTRTAAAAKTAPHAIRFQPAQPRLLPPANCAMHKSESKSHRYLRHNRGANPEEVSKVIGELTKTYPEIGIGFHGHTDRGLGIANTRAAILAGAVQVQGTLLGTGERCGNVNLTTVIGSMQLRGEADFVTPNPWQDLQAWPIPPAPPSRLRCARRTHHRHRSLRTWAGMHGSSERKNPGAYLWCDPALVGANPVIGVNAQSGKANIVLLSEALGNPLDSAQAQAFIDANQAMIEGGGFTASDVSFRLACMKVLGTLPDRFNVKGWRVIDESDETKNRYVQASMLLSVGGSHVMTTRAEGAGPVDALTKAMRQELEKWYPQSQKCI